MNKIVLSMLCLVATSGMVLASGAVVAVPGPLLGVVGGPWGIVAAAGVYGAYRYFKSKR